MNAKLKRLKKQIERVGGEMMIPDDMPEDVAEMFLKMIADCPDCAAALAASTKPRRLARDH